MKQLIIALLLPLTVLAQKNPFVLTGQLSADNAKVFLFYGDKQDSTTLQHGQFVFKGNIDEPVPAVIALQREDGFPDYIFCFIEKGSMEMVGKDSLMTATFNAGKVNMEMQELLLQLKPIRATQRAIFQAYSATPFKERIPDHGREKYIPARESEQQVYLQYANGHPNSLVSIEALRRYVQGRQEHAGKANEVFNTLSAAIKSSAAGKDLHQQLQKQLK